MGKILYSYNAPRPKPAVRLVVIKPNGKEQELEITSKITQFKRVLDVSGDADNSDIYDLIREGENEAHLRRHRFSEIGEDLGLENASLRPTRTHHCKKTRQRSVCGESSGAYR
jgi:hypothetical protein